MKSVYTFLGVTMAALTGLFRDETERRKTLRNAVMIGTHGEQRAALRLLTTAPAVVRANEERHVGLVRDLSSTGLFLYSDFAPSMGAELSITVRLQAEETHSKILQCTGSVVRVEDSRNGSAVGIGIQFEEETVLPQTG
jgi:hypothetical protein